MGSWFIVSSERLEWRMESATLVLQGKQSNNRVTSRPLLGTNWAASWQNQQCGCAPSEDSDQPGHPPSLIRVFAVRLMGSLGPKLSSCEQRRLWSDWADAQADLSLSWAHSHIVCFVRRLKFSFVRPPSVSMIPQYRQSMVTVGKGWIHSVWENSLHSFSFCRKPYWTSASYLIKSMK